MLDNFKGKLEKRKFYIISLLFGYLNRILFVIIIAKSFIIIQLQNLLLF